MPSSRPGRVHWASSGRGPHPAAPGQRGGDVRAEEDLADGRGRQYLGGRAVADEPASGQAEEPAHHRGERAHHVLDPDHRDALGVDRADDLDELGHLRVGQAAGHLVEQQQPGLGGEGAGQFQPLALEQAEPRGGQVGLAGHAGPVQCLRRRRVAGPAPQPAALLRGDQQVLEHGHVRERARHLIGAPDAQPAPRRRIQLGDRAAVEGDLTGARSQIAGDEAEQAGLASSVRPHDPDGVAGSDAERELLGDDDLAEPFRHLVELEQRAGHPVTGWSA